MKKYKSIRSLITLVVILALMLSLSGAAYSAEAPATGSVTVTGGTLELTAENIGFAGVSLDGDDQTPAGTTAAWTATDPTGTGAGWNLTIISTDFTTSAVQEVYNDATGGTFTLDYNSGTTVDIAFNANAAAVKAAIDTIANPETVTVTGSGTSEIPWVVRFNDITGGTMTATDGSLTGGELNSIITPATIDISVNDERFEITLDVATVLDGGNNVPISSVTGGAYISATSTSFLAAATDTGMGSYSLTPTFILGVPAETYAATYTATVTIAINSAP